MISHVTGDECIQVLERLGFDVRSNSSRLWLVEQGGVAIVFPAQRELTRAVLDELLSTLGVGEERFRAVLDEIRRYEAPTLRAIPVAR